jgi:hypothetical protein
MLRVMGLLIVLIVVLALAAVAPTGNVADAGGSQLHRTPTVWVLCLIPERCHKVPPPNVDGPRHPPKTP